MFTRTAIYLIGLAGVQQAGAQQAGRLARDEPPPMAVEQCTHNSGCIVKHTTAVLDANWRWTHNVAGYQNCFTDGKWSSVFCKDPNVCAATCAVEGVDAQGYERTYGVRPIPGGVELQFVSGTGNVGSRLYLLEGMSYKVFKLKNREFTFDVDVSELPCGLNGAVYFVEMDPTGGKGSGNNTAGAMFGVGYCDAQCPHDVKWVEGEANVEWLYGACCMEMDIWEANRRASAFTPHTCSVDGTYRCEGLACGDTSKGERYLGVCDKDGCDINAFRMGDRQFFGAGAQFAVDSTKPMTVVTQFLTENDTDEGDLSEIRRLYVQDGSVIAQANSTIPDVEGSSITDDFCSAQKLAFSDPNVFAAKGGLKKMGEALDRGLVLVLSIWDDAATEMRWLDSTFPTDASSLEPGALRGPCDNATSKPGFLRTVHADATVKYTNIKYGEIGSTYLEHSRRLGTVLV